MNNMKKTAVIVFNLGGPDRLEAVRPFLFNLFRDPAIIGLPNPLRWSVAQLISRRRAPYAKPLYQSMGGKSPLLEGTERQAQALEKELGESFKVFICMRYWHPLAPQVVADVIAWGAERLVLLPLYPQFSTTTTASSFLDWEKESKKAGLSLPTIKIDQYPDNQGLVDAFCELAAPLLIEARKYGPPRLLFSAHGIPKSRIDRGDPYEKQVEQTARSILENLAEQPDSWKVCYQSKVGPLQWLEPAIGDEMERAGRDGVPVVVLPIAFVSEHVETLIELDVEYREKASHCNVPYYGRVQTPGTHPRFIEGLAMEVRNATLS